VLREHPALLGIPPAPPPDLRERGACRGKVELFWSERPEDVEAAKSHCRACLVRSLCLSYALGQTRVYGIWGGMDDEERASARIGGLLDQEGIVLRGRSVDVGLAAGGGPIS